jgi:hypothetical protein
MSPLGPLVTRIGVRRIHGVVVPGSIARCSGPDGCAQDGRLNGIHRRRLLVYISQKLAPFVQCIRKIVCLLSHPLQCTPLSTANRDTTMCRNTEPINIVITVATLIPY